MKTSLALLFSSLWLVMTGLSVAGCGGKRGTVQLDIVVSPLDDPFVGEANVRFTIGGVAHTTPITSGGHFSFSSQQSPPKSSAPVYIDVLDSAGNVVAHGESPVLALSAMNQGPYSVWVGRLGTIAAASAKLDTPRAEIAAMNATGLGGIFAGGRDSSMAAIKQVAIYDVYTQSILQSEDSTIQPMANARAGAAAVPDAPNGIVFGGAQQAGFGSTGTPLASAELFNPSGNAWDTVPADGTVQAAAYPGATILADGTGLITGGINSAGVLLAQALTIPTGGSTTAVTPLLSMMTAGRVHHASAPAMFPGGAGALIIGGLATGSGGSIMDQYVNSQFTAFSVSNGTVENRSYAVAVGLSDGVLLVGGEVPVTGGSPVATASCLFISTSGTPSVQPYDAADMNALLSVPRAHHTVTAVGTQLLACGGIDDMGKAIASCDLIDTSPVLKLNKTIMMGDARYDHAAVQLETGPVLLVGGLSSPTSALQSIEIYTPANVLTPSPSAASSTSSALEPETLDVTFSK